MTRPPVAQVLLATAATVAERRDDDLLVELLSARGIPAAHAVWDDPAVEWDRARLVVVRTTWDYTGRLGEFLAWAEKVDAVTRLENPLAVLRWNTHKRYLDDLAARGVPVVPTLWLRAGDRADLGALLDQRGWTAAVVKPAVSAGARGTVTVGAAPRALPRDHAQAHLDALSAAGDVMVQPYLHGIADGEISVLFADGEPTHAVRKRPRPDDFRVQEQFGGATEGLDLAAVPLAAATDALAAASHPTLYARADLVDGLLIELELVEPALFLETAPAAAQRLADAVVGRLA